MCLFSAGLFNHTGCCFMSKHYAPMHPWLSSFSCYGKHNLFIFFQVPQSLHQLCLFSLFQIEKVSSCLCNSLATFSEECFCGLSYGVSPHMTSSTCELLASFYKVFSVPSFLSVSKLKLLIRMTVLSVQPCVFLPIRLSCISCLIFKNQV